MTRYAAVSWPLAGILVALALVAQDLGLKALGADQPPLGQMAFRVAAWTIAVACLTLLILPRRRAAYLLGFLVCAGLMGWALYLQYGLDLEPCPLCVFQRVAVIATGVVFLVAAIHNPGRRGAAFYAALATITAGVGAALAAWHVWIQAQPQGSVPACGMGLEYMLETLPLTDVIARVLKGSGECAEQGWIFLGLGIPAWTFVFFVAMIAAAVALVRRDQHSAGNFANSQRIAEFALANRMPAQGTPEAGMLLAYGASGSDNFRRAAWFVKEILGGKRPADLPFEQPTKLTLTINARIARALGLALPQSLLLQATEVIQ